MPCQSPDIRTVPVFIYGLCEPSGLIRYVGRSDRPKLRFRAHCKRGTRPVKQWVSELRSRGQKPGLVILYEVPPGQDSEPVEYAFIDALRCAPSELLLNVAGTGASRHCRFCGGQDHDGGSLRRPCRFSFPPVVTRLERTGSRIPMRAWTEPAP